jgi:hypothetical protein
MVTRRPPKAWQHHIVRKQKGSTAMNRHIPIVISEGDPFTRGQHLGSSQAGRVRQAARAYMTLFNQFAGLSRNDVYTEVERFIVPKNVDIYGHHIFCLI